MMISEMDGFPIPDSGIPAGAVKKRRHFTVTSAIRNPERQNPESRKKTSFEKIKELMVCFGGHSGDER
jgi:hypothetical protein